jgi:hypothetical protein
MGCSYFHNVIFLLWRREPSNQRLLLVQYAFTYCRLLTADNKVTGGPSNATLETFQGYPFLTRGALVLDPTKR